VPPSPTLPGVSDQVLPPADAGAVDRQGGPARALVVRARRRLADDVVGLELADPAGGALPAWEPGAHVDVTVRPGVVRQYSLCGDPADRTVWRIGVLREPAGRGGSVHLHDQVGVGAVLTVGPPRNAFPLVPASRYLLIAGGIGITPLVPMAAELAARGADWRLLYGGRRSASMAFADELARHGDRVVLHPQDSHGLLPLGPVLDGMRAAGGHIGAAVYCCGPPALLAAVEQACADWPPGALRIERFQPVVAAHQAGDRAFAVRLAASGRTVRVAAGQSVLAALEADGLAVTSSCRDGTCGTCETQVVEGAVDHRDTVLTEAERAAGETMMICVSRAAGERLTLDL
jgi:ferredoxin-NADP reductase